ncbi:MAG: 2-amino-4-hydroxy-6-hydroxymethyldihydropteridine diphosphokinase [Bacteroidaceae bacterium]|nr:2-amino-4-hydroxy-6-hydroxymethyldihydropteridine diphosphokinase [Bacteroidaceae bacterium]
MHQVYLGLGTNLGDKEANLKAAVEEIGKRVGEVTSLSAFHSSEPWGFESENSFLNAVCCVSTFFSPIEVLRLTQDIERSLGRFKKSVNRQYSDRLIDIDILLYDDLHISTPELIIPHPLMWERDFVMTPLREIAPNITP